MGRLHPNVLKLRKQKRQGKRAYLKSYFGEIKVPRSVGTSGIPEDAKAMFDYRTRGGTFWDDTLDKLFGLPRGNPLMFSQERMAVIKKLQQLTAEVPAECNVVVRRGGITKTTLRFYFTPDYTRCFFMQTNTNEMVVLKSKVYCGAGAKDRAYFDLANNRLEWWDRVTLPTILDPDVPPSG